MFAEIPSTVFNVSLNGIELGLGLGLHARESERSLDTSVCGLDFFFYAREQDTRRVK
jgi:hypothetical protein